MKDRERGSSGMRGGTITPSEKDDYLEVYALSLLRKKHVSGGRLSDSERRFLWSRYRQHAIYLALLFSL